jgi:hypothetical protein
MSRFHAARVEDLTTKELTARAIALVEAEIQRVPMSKWPIKWDDVTMGDVEPRELVFNTLIQAQRNLYSDGTQSCTLGSPDLLTVHLFPIRVSDMRPHHCANQTTCTCWVIKVGSAVKSISYVCYRLLRL